MGAADRSLRQTLHHMGPTDRPTIANLCLVQFSVLQKPCGCFVPFDKDDDDDTSLIGRPPICVMQLRLQKELRHLAI